MNVRMNFQKKLYISCGILMAALVIVSGVFFYQYNYRTLSENMRKSSLNAVELLDTQFNSILSNTNELVKSIQINKDFLSIIHEAFGEEENYFSKKPSVANSLKSIFLNILLAKPGDEIIEYISSTYDHVGISANNALAYQEKTVLKENELLRSFLETKDYLIYVPPHPNMWGKKEETVISVVRPVRDAYVTYGVLEYDIGISKFEQILENASGDQGRYQMLILDENGRLVYTSPGCENGEEIYKLHRENMQENALNGTFQMDVSTICAYKKSQVTDWTTVLIWDVTSFSEGIQRLLMITIVASGLSILVVALFLYLLTSNLTSPLRKLCAQLEHGEISEAVKVNIESDNNEVVALTNAVREMLNQICIQNHKLIEEQNRTFQAHYRTLEAQLNPHFLYNTLSVIGANGLDRGDIEVFNMCSELASILRYSISSSGKEVSLKEEFENIRSYLYIMQMRYENGLSILWNLDERLNEISVPKLILQPIVENCFKHGFKDELPPYRIEVRSYLEKDYWYVEVVNNGAMLPKEKTAEINRKLKNLDRSFLSEHMEASKMSGFGIENTVIRLHIYYAGDEFFQIESEEKRTTVTIGGKRYDRKNEGSDCRR